MKKTLLSIHCDLYSLGPIGCQNENLSYPIHKKRNWNAWGLGIISAPDMTRDILTQTFYLHGRLVMWTFLPQRCSGMSTVPKYLSCAEMPQYCKVLVRERWQGQNFYLSKGPRRWNVCAEMSLAKMSWHDVLEVNSEKFKHWRLKVLNLKIIFYS